jgi:hypothetical protein
LPQCILADADTKTQVAITSFMEAYMSTDVNDSIQEEGICKKTKIINFTTRPKVRPNSDVSSTKECLDTFEFRQTFDI